MFAHAKSEHKYTLKDTVQKKETEKSIASPNLTGIPDTMKSRFENLSGFSFDDVRVHYNSDKPERLQALAYTQGNQVYIGPGQEKHLQHELGHVVQQIREPVSVSGFVSGVPINDNPVLEQQANLFGHILQSKPNPDRQTALFYRRKATPVVQRYQRQGPYIQSLAIPPNPRQIMIDEREPATLYVRTGAVLPVELGHLGIVPDGALIPDPFMAGNGNFSRLRQNTIPNTRVLQEVVEEIPRDERTKWQKFKSIFGYTPTRKVMREQVLPNQPQRSLQDQQSAALLLTKQTIFINRALAILQNVENIFNQQPVAQAQLTLQRGQTERLILDWYENQDRTSVVSVSALGTDIMNTVFAIYELTAPLVQGAPNPLSAVENATLQDKLIMINMLRHELGYRLNQVSREQDVVHLEPQIPTGCNLSAMERSRFINPAIGTRNRELAAIEKRKFNEIGWPFHYATDIPVNYLTPDHLMIEDAVGKSSSGYEIANAHWVAHLYGQDEALGGGPIVGGPVGGPPPAPAPPVLIPNCEFNQMSQPMRNAYLQSRAILTENTWEITYEQERLPNPNRTFGHISVGLNAAQQFTYQLIPVNGQTLTVAMQDFLIKMVSAIAEDLIIQDFALEGFKQRTPDQQGKPNELLRQTMANQFISPNPGPRLPTRFNAGIGKYKIEELH